jgi:Raf kinase inhibitor-like YbhB/YbcL family protein
VIAPRARVPAIAFVTLLFVAACGSSSRTQPPPITMAGASAAPATASARSTIAPAMETTMPMTLTSPDFAEGGAIPTRFTCDGDNVSPTLEWAGVPDTAATLALVVTDPDAHGFVHWVVYDIDVSATGGIQAGWSTTADAAPQGQNGFGDIGWGGPCPPSGTHRYEFRLIALDTSLDLKAGPTADDVAAAAAGHILDEVTLTATYARS